ncbi:MAG TPA: CBS domain-containing protein [Anaerolineaceae bacterium]|jgi:CBS domain-containing protein/anti-sigma regulatory factor (Ser/Thr protein kinase)
MPQNPPQQARIITDKVAEGITRVEELAYELKIEEVMTREIKALTPEMQMIDVLDLFRQERISGAPVVVDGQLIGVVSIEDLIRLMRHGNLEDEVRESMTTKVITVRPTDSVVDALKIFVNVNVGRLPVLDVDGKLVGIITKGDITRGLLGALQRDYQAEELIRYRASHLFEDIVSDRTTLVLRYKIKPHDFNNGGTASSHIKRALLRLGASPQIARRCGIASYESEMNLIIHATHGGTIRVDIEPHQISMEAYDDGPGIKDIHCAMQPGYSTAPEEIREQGFGAGMGLTNIQRYVDEMKLESSVERGTNLRMKIYLTDTDVFGEPNKT